MSWSVHEENLFFKSYIMLCHFMKYLFRVQWKLIYIYIYIYRSFMSWGVDKKKSIQNIALFYIII